MTDMLEYPGRERDVFENVTLLDLADRLLHKGVVIGGDIVISVAGVDLVYVSLRALISSVETALERQLGEGIAFR
jgi:gas vesicle structural protein